ncbi:DUF4034 domain-containing protein [Puniceicoccus vermicola]|uniref:DUF4034 domain-containing protein n=1 Tax=Puniceicoccus vermicola TaxID=388746 RepID=A0A7X1AZL3_9BACT|nr:DUF4034 domain-containing protein [Puniceicoccus vermicola]MBC2602890.1 DUF4034 domain-containing protein [Puniceicoccus vermicola]
MTILLLCACRDDRSDFENHPGRDPDRALESSHGNRGGPVEHIDANERREAALLEQRLGPVQREIRLYRADIRSAFEEENFEFLEEQAQEARESRSVFGDGSFQISQFYEGLADRFGRSDDQLILDSERLDRWLEEMPYSDTAKIAYGRLLTDWAWYVRGSGFSRTVSNRQWKQFYQLLAAARSRVGPLVNEDLEDPYAGMVMLRVALGQGWSPSEYAELMALLEEKFPDYWGFYVQRAYSLLPRWNGEEGDWEAYALEIANSRGEFGKEAYVRILFNLVGFYGNIFRDSGAQWPPAQEGLHDLLEDYPESLELLSSSARLATLGRDRKLAEQLFEKLGDSYTEESWLNPEQFVHFRTWARTGQW